MKFTRPGFKKSSAKRYDVIRPHQSRHEVSSRTPKQETKPVHSKPKETAKNQQPTSRHILQPLAIIVVAVASLVALSVFGPQPQTTHDSANDLYPNAATRHFLRELLHLPAHRAIGAVRKPGQRIAERESSIPSNTDCRGKTVMDIVAHQDDDLLFMNPDIMHDLDAGNCIRTVYLTDGDDGLGQYYAAQRQAGAEAAYNSMLGGGITWNQITVSLPSGNTFVVATSAPNTNVSLIFFNLPDGNLNGQGFYSSGHASLSKLYDGSINTIHSVGGASSYTSQQLVHTLADVMASYKPATVRTQADDSSLEIGDHSDHIATGLFATLATLAYQQMADKKINAPLEYYMGYPIRDLDQNIFDQDMQRKSAAFFAYAAHDASVCISIEDCTGLSLSYEEYLSRQYQFSSGAAVSVP